MTGTTPRRLPKAIAAVGIAAAGVLALPTMAGATAEGKGVETVRLSRGEPVNLAGNCLFDGKPGMVIGVIAGLHHKKSSKSFSAWVDADKHGDFKVAVKLSHDVTETDVFVGGALCVDKKDKKHRKVIKPICIRGKKGKHEMPKGTGTTMPEVPEEVPSVEEIEEVIEEEAAPKVEAPVAVVATPAYTG